MKLFNVYRCLDCNEAIYGQENFESHLCSGAIHEDNSFEFDWIVPQTGLLHFEMNAAKSFINFCWEPFMREICMHLGFVSENAQIYAKKGSDHHKLWDLLKIVYIALTDELLVEFVRFCIRNNMEPSVDNYWSSFSKKVKNPNYAFLQQMVLTFLHALMIFRKGMRSNNQQYIYAGKDKLSLLFYGRNHPHYHLLIAQEKRIEALMPREVLNLKYSSLVLSRTGRAGHYQSGDAIIEEINKEGKRDLVGVPNETQWKRAFRNLDMMNQVRSSTFRDAGIKDTKVSSYDTERDIKKEV